MEQLERWRRTPGDGRCAVCRTWPGVRLIRDGDTEAAALPELCPACGWRPHVVVLGSSDSDTPPQPGSLAAEVWRA